MPSIVDVLKRIAGTGESVTLVYNAGTRPGQPRSVVPISVDREQLTALEPGFKDAKTYRIERIASIELRDGTRALNPTAAPPPSLPQKLPDVPSLPSLREYVETYRGELVDTGWHIHFQADSLGVGGYFKNGKPKKTPSVLVRYLGPGSALLFDQADALRARPWRVDSWRQRTCTNVSTLSAAFAIFLAEVRSSNAGTARSVWSQNADNQP